MSIVDRIGYILEKTLLRRFGLILSCMLLLSLAAAVKAGEHARLETVNFIAAFVQSFVFGYAVALVDLWLKGRRWWRNTVFSVLGILMFVDLWCSIVLHARPEGYLVDLTIQTNRSEISEFFDHYVLNLDTLAILLGTVIISWAAMHLLSPLEIRLKVPYTLLTAAFTVLIASNIYAFIHASEMEKIRIGPRNSLQMCYKAIANRTDYGGIIERVTKSVTGARVDSCSYQSKKIVLVVGESHSRLHSSIYGYPLTTMPNIEAEAANGNVIVFDSAYTTHSLTSQVMARMYSTATDKERWPDSPLFPAVFRKAGYHVSLFDNQATCYDLRGAFDIEANYFISAPKVAEACFDERNDALYEFDDMMLARHPVYNGTPSLTIYHLMGQHFEAKKRYPPSFGKFSASDYSRRTDLNDRQITETAHYDNATLFTDHNLGMIIDGLRDEDAVLVYVSDHGEEVHDFRDRYGRIFDSPAECIKAVPMLVWYSDTYKAEHPDIISYINEISAHRFVNTYISDLLFYLAGIHIDETPRSVDPGVSSTE